MATKTKSGDKDDAPLIDLNEASVKSRTERRCCSRASSGISPDVTGSGNEIIPGELVMAASGLGPHSNNAHTP